MFADSEYQCALLQKRAYFEITRIILLLVKLTIFYYVYKFS
jgi:hypothetical protein